MHSSVVVGEGEELRRTESKVVVLVLTNEEGEKWLVGAKHFMEREVVCYQGCG